MRADAFSKQHPAVNFVFFVGAIVGAVIIQHPLYLLAGILCSGSYYLLLNGSKGWKTILGLLPLFLVLTAVNPLFNRYGSTVLFTYWGRPYTLEALLYGAAIAAIFVEMILWFGCYNAVLTGDKFTALFGNLIPVLSLLLVMVLRMIPNFLRKAKQIAGARRSIGMDEGDGGKAAKLTEGLTVLGALTSWALEGSIQTADSMKSRGYGTGRRTGFMLYSMTGSDWVLLGCEAVLLLLAVLFGDTTATYTPAFYIAPVGGIRILGFASYAAYLLIPTVLHIKEAVQWHISISKI